MSSGPMSLVDQKRLQWAREREEMVGLCGLWGSDTTRLRADHIGVPALPSRSVHVSSVDLSSVSGVASRPDQMQRRPSLPPIAKPGQQQQHSQGENQSHDSLVENSKAARYHEEESEETSGYASDSNGNNDCGWDTQAQRNLHRHIAQQVERIHSSESLWEHHLQQAVRQTAWTQQALHSERPRFSGTGSSVSANSCGSWSEDAGRARWGDRGVGVGHLWEPSDPSDSGPSRLPPMQTRVPPSWIHRDLKDSSAEVESGSEILVINHPHSPNLGEGTGESPSAGDNTYENACRSFLRGQNVPLEAEILAERQKKREKALEHQNAIRQQLEERDRKRKEERERKQREERLEEERVRREQEELRRRAQEEQRRLQEKEEQESRRNAAMLQALQEAEKQAKEQKVKQSRKHVSGRERSSPKSSNNQRTPRTPKSRDESAPVTSRSKSRKEDSGEADDAAQLAERLSSMHVAESAVACQDGSRVQPTPTSIQAETAVSSGVNDHLPAPGCQNVAQPGALPSTTSWFPVLELLPSSTNLSHTSDVLADVPPLMPFSEGLALVIPTSTMSPREGNQSLSGSDHSTRIIAPPQVALLMSPMATVSPDGTRLLTPTKFRRRVREAATQTSAGIRRGLRGLTSGASRIRSGANRSITVRGMKNGLHSRQQVGERPKWGVNRPGTQYRTQSEKDLNYQQRLQRIHQKLKRNERPGSGSGSGSSGSGAGRPNTGSQLEQSRSPSPSTRGESGTPYSDDVLSRTYRVCRGDTSFGEMSAASPRTSSHGHFSSLPSRKGETEHGNRSHSKASEPASPGTPATTEPSEILTRLSSLKQGLLWSREIWTHPESLISEAS